MGVIHCVGERERECEKERAEEEAKEASEEGGGTERRVVVVCETGDVVEESEESEEDESEEDEVKECLSEWSWLWRERDDDRTSQPRQPNFAPLPPTTLIPLLPARAHALIIAYTIDH